MKTLEDALDEVARTPVLLVAADYDGTLAPIVAEPSQAEAHRESLVAMKALAALPQTHIAVISGRALSDLARRLVEAQDVHLIGSHGSEYESGLAAHLPDEIRALHGKLTQAAQRIAGSVPGAMVEIKPASIAFHYRNADEQAGEAVAQEVLSTLATWPGVHVQHGKKVVELSLIETNKGKALQRLRQRVGASAVIVFGDDETDEDAFATLAGPDMGIKVGDGATHAKYRLADTPDVAQALARLSERRAQWLAGSEAVPIEEHSYLSDQRTSALVTPRGRITWMCAPRLDSSAIFADLLGGETAGHFDILPVDARLTPRQQYLGNSFVLQTDWGPLRVTDYLECTGGRPFQRAGRSDLIRVIEGQGRVRIVFAPRLDFGGLETRLRLRDGGLEIEGAVDPCVLYSPDVRWTIQDEGRHQTAVAEIDVVGGPIVLELRWGTANLNPPPVPESRRRELTERFWSIWASTLRLPSVRPELVMRSALALRALIYGPSGAIAAAGTTSLPESAGGIRNWDYRFCWPRDAAMAATALARLNAPGPGMKLLDWVLGILEDTEPPAFIRPLYTVTGGHLGPEGSIEHLAGYLGSRPVRVGNAAAHQIQLDVLGPIAELLRVLAQQGAALTSEHWRMLTSMVTAVANRWHEADHGIWEIRGSRQHHVHSKVMCWQTVDRAIQIADYMGRSHDNWDALRDAIANDVLTKGWNAQRNAYCATYEGSDTDAATLWVGLSGLLPASDPRFTGTVDAVERDLLEDCVVYRYRFDDDLPGIEGGFNICTTWLIESYAMLGRWTDAQGLFERYIALAGATGLMAEEYDPHDRRALGNFPQAYSHLGLINCALRLAERPQ